MPVGFPHLVSTTTAQVLSFARRGVSGRPLFHRVDTVGDGFSEHYLPPSIYSAASRQGTMTTKDESRPYRHSLGSNKIDASLSVMWRESRREAQGLSKKLGLETLAKLLHAS